MEFKYATWRHLIKMPFCMFLLTGLMISSAFATTSCPQPEPPAAPNAKTAATQKAIDAYAFSYKQYRVRMNMYQRCIIEFEQTSLRTGGMRSREEMAQAMKAQQEQRAKIAQQVTQVSREYQLFLDLLQRSGKHPSPQTQETIYGQSTQATITDNPCGQNTKYLQRQQASVALRKIYTGNSNISKLPSSPAVFPKEIPAGNSSCVKMSFTVFGEGQQRRVAELTLLGLTDPTAPSDAPYVAAAKSAIEIAVREDLFPEIAKEGWNYEVNIPVWREHSLFSGRKTQVANKDLAHLGYYDAVKVGDIDNTQVFKVESLHPATEVFVVIKKFKPDELIEKEASEMLPWFRKHVAPHVQGDAQSTTASASVYFYDRDIIFPPKPRSRDLVQYYPPQTLDPASTLPVARALKTFLFHGQRVQRGTPLEWWNPPINQQADTFTTLAKIQEQSNQLEQIAQKQRDYFQQNAANPQRINPKQAEYEAQIKADRDLAAKQGTIYRPPSYWATYATYPEVGQIFNGAIRNREALEHSIAYMQLYMRYQAYFSVNCPALIPKGAPTYTYETTTEYNNMPPISTYSDTVQVRPEYWEKFNELKDKVGTHYSGVYRMALNDVGSVNRIITDTIQGANSDLERIFKENDCNSGFQQQFSENLRRLAYGEKTLQTDTSTTFTFVDRDTSKHQVKPKLASACFDAKSGRATQKDVKFCQCLDRRFSGILNAAEMSDAITNYKDFAQKIYYAPEAPRDPMRKYSDTAQECIRELNR